MTFKTGAAAPALQEPSAICSRASAPVGIVDPRSVSCQDDPWLIGDQLDNVDHPLDHRRERNRPRSWLFPQRLRPPRFRRSLCGKHLFIFRGERIRADHDLHKPEVNSPIQHQIGRLPNQAGRGSGKRREVGWFPLRQQSALCFCPIQSREVRIPRGWERPARPMPASARI